MRCSKACIGRAVSELTITAHFSSSASSLLIKELLINKPNKTIIWNYSGLSNNLNRKVYQKRCTRAEAGDVISYIISVISRFQIKWRRCVGIEPTCDRISATHTVLKTGAPTSDASISVLYLQRVMGTSNWPIPATMYILCTNYADSDMQTSNSRSSMMRLFVSIQMLQNFFLIILPRILNL